MAWELANHVTAVKLWCSMGISKPLDKAFIYVFGISG